MPKKPSHDLWQGLKALQRRLDQAPQVDFVKRLLFRHPLLDVFPHLLVRIELRRVRRQEVQFQPAVGGRDVFAHPLRFVNRMAIDHQENGLNRAARASSASCLPTRSADRLAPGSSAPANHGADAGQTPPAVSLQDLRRADDGRAPTLVSGIATLARPLAAGGRGALTW